MTSNTKSNEVIDILKNDKDIEYLMEMIEVPAGSFMMGSEKMDDTKPVLKVTFDKSFFVGKYPVTQELWKHIMGKQNNPAMFKGDSRPVENVSWDQVKDFIDKLNELNKNRQKYRLLSEAEWEYSAKGGEQGAKENLKYAGSNRLKEVGWYYKNSMDETKPVGLKMPNQLGIFDMSGNVWEWCEDTWIDNYRSHLKDGSPFLKGDKGFRVVRGGSWDINGDFCSVFDRFRFIQGSRSNVIGFRLARY